MAVPLLHEERALGVLEVLDRPQRSQFSLDEMDLLGLFANQAAIALDLLRRARHARGRARGEAGKAPAWLLGSATALEALDEEQRAAGAAAARSRSRSCSERGRGRLSRPRIGRPGRPFASVGCSARLV